jgi:hypothetical protein
MGMTKIHGYPREPRKALISPTGTTIFSGNLKSGIVLKTPKEQNVARGYPWILVGPLDLLT